jgi:chemotaxis protein MotA
MERRSSRLKSHVLGLFFGIFVIVFVATSTSNDTLAWFDMLSVAIVFGGTLSVSIMTNGIVSTLKFFRLFIKIFIPQKFDNVSVSKELVSLSKKKYYNDLDLKQINETNYHPFILEGLKLIENKFDSEKLSGIMCNMIDQRQDFYDKQIEQIESLIKYPTAFGMMGTLIGLVSVLKQIDTPDSMSTIGPSMAIALITTLYGIFLSNYVLMPISDNLQTQAKQEIKTRQVIAQGIILISEGHDPIYTREAILSFLSPEEKKQFARSTPSAVSHEELAA